MPKEISVVIPSYKRADWIIELLNSLAIGQGDYNKFEVIVVDDGSPDGEEKEAQITQKKWPFNFRYLRQENRGPATARNTGIKVSEGEIIAFLDDDTLATPGWVEQIAQGYAMPGIGGIAGNTVGLKPKTLAERFLFHVHHLHQHQFDDSNQLSYICTANCSFLRGAIQEINGFNEMLPLAAGDDMDLGFRLRGKGYSFVYNEKAVVYHRHRSTLPLMWKLFFVSGRGAYMAARLNRGSNLGHVTSKTLFEPQKVMRVFSGIPKKISKNFRVQGIPRIEAILYPLLELSNHFCYQFGRLYERFIGRTIK